jgi:murein DD-endopeptidase MepM/ murein hydrolase activator NlpD
MNVRHYIVESGDTMTSIGQKFGVPWRQIYGLPENSVFRLRRPDPNRIQPGDVIAVPATNDAARRLGAFQSMYREIPAAAEYEAYRHMVEASRKP